jgi:phosphoserine phosphatase
VTPRRPNFRTVVLDVDSTLSGIEGIDWLAARKGPDEAQRVAALTERAMAGEIRLEDVYAERLSIVKPRAEDVAALSEAYVENIAPGAREVVRSWLAEGIKVVIVSGGIRGALLRLAEHLGVPGDDVHAVAILHDAGGIYEGHDPSPLAVATGKREILERLELPRPVLAVGDGSTDLEMKQVADAFAAFTGFAARPNVTARADYVVTTFDELSALVAAT